MLYWFIGSGDGFMIIKPSNFSQRGQEAKLYSDEITGSLCMRFYFYLYGNETGYLRIGTKKQKSSNEHIVFNHYGNHGHKWNLAQIYLNFSPTDVYQVLHSDYVWWPIIRWGQLVKETAPQTSVK